MAQPHGMVNAESGGGVLALWSEHRERLAGFSRLLAGEAGRLLFSLVYFVTLAKVLPLDQFGIFASASAVGVVLARVSAFGFNSPLYRIATTKPSLLGSYTAGYLCAVLLTLPIVLAAIWGIHATLYGSLIALSTFALIVLTEAVLWRTLEVNITVQHGLDRFGVASGMAIAGGGAKAAAALWFAASGEPDLERWAVINAVAVGVTAAIGTLLFWPRRRLSWHPRGWLGRVRDAMGVSGAEALFYVQSDLDRLLVLKLGGEALAGLYAIVMRLADLTAMPMRAANVMLVQWIMRGRRSGTTVSKRVLVEIAIAATSAAALGAMAVALHVLPEWFGPSIALAATVLGLMLAVPAFRNLLEYHTELLYAHEAMATRVALLAVLTVAKALGLWWVLSEAGDFATVALRLNLAFAILWVLSALVTYRRIGSGEQAAQ